MTFRDPKLARYNRVHVSFNDYEIEWLETLLHESGGELARLVHDLAVAQLEEEITRLDAKLEGPVVAHEKRATTCRTSMLNSLPTNRHSSNATRNSTDSRSCLLYTSRCV